MKYIIANQEAVYGIGDTPEAAHAEARQFADDLPALTDLPTRPSTGMYVGRASAALIAEIECNPQAARCPGGDWIEYTLAEHEAQRSVA